MFDRDAGRTVKMPRRKSERAEHELVNITGNTFPEPVVGVAATGTWRGTLVAIHQEPGITGKRKWMKYTVEGEDEVAFTTFSHTDALLARCALEGGDRIFIEWKLDNWDGKSIVAIGPEEDAP